MRYRLPVFVKDGSALFLQSLELLLDGRAEVLAAFADNEYFILVSRRRDKMFSVKSNQVEQCLLVQIVKLITERNIGMLPPIETCHDIVLAVIEQDVGDIPSLLHHITAPCKIVKPWLSLFRPRLVTVEPLPVDAQP